MVKGAAIKFVSYQESVRNILNILRIEHEIRKHDKIVLKPFLRDADSPFTKVEFVEEVLKFIMEKKNPVAEVFIAEGSDGEDTLYLFEEKGYNKLAEKYSIGLIDLNNTELEDVYDQKFKKFENIKYPSILKNSFVISLPVLSKDNELEMIGSLSNMIGAFPSSEYRGFFSRKKSGIRKNHIRYSIHDIVKAKLPDFTIIDASEQGYVLAGLPLDMDKQAAKILGSEWKMVQHLRVIEDTFAEPKKYSIK